ncbi:MAG: hypothetical protein WKF85_02480 [Chitinophagaceae bacterium]
MDSEIIETVLTEILGELKQSNVLNKENSLTLTENKNRLTIIEKKLESKDEIKTVVDTVPLEQIMSKSINNISAMIEKRPEKVSREFRILLFPEHNAREYYRIVFGRIIFWLVILVIAKYAYLLGSDLISKGNESLKYKKAWEILYKHQEKANQKKMLRLIEDY